MTSLTNSTEWHFYTTTKDAVCGVIDACKTAKTSIKVEQYYLMPDAVGKEFIDVLKQKADEGVLTECIFDSVGSYSLAKSAYSELFNHKNIEVRFFNWLFPFSKGNQKIWYFRNHRRSLVIDSSIAFTGGMCISSDTQDWHEAHVMLKGPIVNQIEHVFEDTWDKICKKSIYSSKESNMNADGFTYSTQSPLPRQRFLYHRLIDAIRQARSYIYLSTPYFLPDRRLMRALRLAKRRGVEVKILLPETANHKIVDIGAKTFFHKALHYGFQIYQYPTMTHAKVAVIDGEWSMVGSLNLDNVSLRYNFEAGLVSINKKFGRDLQELFLEDISKSHLLTMEEWNNRGFVQQFLELLVWPIRKLL